MAAYRPFEISEISNRNSSAESSSECGAERRPAEFVGLACRGPIERSGASDRRSDVLLRFDAHRPRRAVGTPPPGTAPTSARPTANDERTSSREQKRPKRTPPGRARRISAVSNPGSRWVALPRSAPSAPRRCAPHDGLSRRSSAGIPTVGVGRRSECCRPNTDGARSSFPYI